MINIWGPEMDYKPDYWPVWIKFATVLLIFILFCMLAHAILRMIYSPQNATIEDPEKFYLYILPVRIWHWLNALFFIALLCTGILNHFSIGPTESLVKIHSTLGKFYLIIWVVFIVINIITGNMKQYILNFSGAVARIVKQAKYYLYGIIKGEPHPYETSVKNKFNPIQQISYIGVVYGLIPLLLITGILLIFGKSFLISTLHLGLAIIGLIFLLIHLYMCTTGDRPAYLVKGMIDGYHRHDKK